MANRQTHIGGWVENVTNGQTYIGRWVENVTKGQTYRGKKGTDGRTYTQKIVFYVTTPLHKKPDLNFTI